MMYDLFLGKFHHLEGQNYILLLFEDDYDVFFNSNDLLLFTYIGSDYDLLFKHLLAVFVRLFMILN